jgi:endo-1,4-beta-xylanase
MLTRRKALGLAGGFAVSAGAMSAAWEVLSQGAQPQPVKPLGGGGPFKPVPYGAAVHSDELPKDLDYQSALARHCQEVVPEYGLKWGTIEPTRGQRDWRAGDVVVNFARQRNLKVRGHTLVWYEANPEWSKQISNALEAERTLVAHIEAVVSRYRGTIHSWDVVNEPLEDKATSASHHRSSLWFKHLGERYLEIAFRTAAAVDPSCQLVLNEFGIETVTPKDRAKRLAFRDLLRRLRDKGLPIHAVGIQGHINAENAIDKEGLGSFLSDVSAMRLATLITELDMIDNKLPGPIEVRDALTAARTYEMLDAVFSVTRPSAVITWGITDKRTWVPMWNKRDDGMPNRPLPLDADYRPKPMLRVIEHFCRGPGTR